MTSDLRPTPEPVVAARPIPQLIRRIYRHSLSRYLCIGGLSFIADVGILFLTHGVLHIWLPLATTLAYLVAFVVNFGLNRIWAFESNAPVGKQLTRYCALVAVNYGLTLAVVTGLAALGLEYLIAKAIATALTVLINYVAYRHWVFT